MSTSNRIREINDTINEVASVVGASVQIERRAKHYAAVLGYAGKSRQVFFSSTPSRTHVVNQVGRDVKRTLRDMGAPL
jgi:hypothetical protein